LRLLFTFVLFLEMSGFAANDPRHSLLAVDPHSLADRYDAIAPTNAFGVEEPFITDVVNNESEGAARP
jgi:hypothetical protein